MDERESIKRGVIFWDDINFFMGSNKERNAFREFKKDLEALIHAHKVYRRYKTDYEMKFTSAYNSTVLMILDTKWLLLYSSFLKKYVGKFKEFAKK